MDKELFKKDFYEAVNKEWLTKAKIPADKSATGAFEEIDRRNEKLVKKLCKKLVKERQENTLEDITLQNYADLQMMASDYQTRDRLGVEPLLPYLAKIEELKSFDDLNKNFEFYFTHGFPVPFDFSITNDFKNVELQKLAFSGPLLILPEKSYYDDKHPLKKTLLAGYSKMCDKLLSKYSIDKKQRKELISKTLAFDASLVPYTMSAVERSNYVKMYNPYKMVDAQSKSSLFDFKVLSEKLTGKIVDELIVIYPKFIDNLDKIYNNNTFENFKAWMYVNTIVHLSGYLDNNSRITAGEYSRLISGQAKPKSKEKSAFYMASGIFGMPLGLEYAHKYFGAKAKKNVEHMVHNMIDIYKSRLRKNTWLSKNTIAKAIQKLDNLGIHIGYPNQIKPIYKEYIITSYRHGGNLLTNILNITSIKTKYELAQYMEPVNRELWEMTPDEVNAYYNPFMNQIVFPAGILNAPFYSIKQSSSQNYGGIGAVIAHEISHAFDSNGANFDQNGNLKMWWKKEEIQIFKDLCKKMIQLFDKAPTWVGPCNGELTVSENVADGGGISCALEAAKLEKDYNAQEFFINWATVWRTLYKEAIAKKLLDIDVHAPAKLRANQQVKNLAEFYEAFDIKKDDPMYLDEDKRVNIW